MPMGPHARFLSRSTAKTFCALATTFRPHIASDVWRRTEELMAQDMLVSIHRWSRALVTHLGPFRGIARQAFRRLLQARVGKGVVAAYQNGRLWRLSPEVALRGAFQEFETIEWLRTVVSTGMAVIDVGANVGQMTLELATLVGPSGKVVAIEPGLGNIEVLKRHIDANGMRDRVEVIAAACAETHGDEVEFFIAGQTPGSVGSGHSLLDAAARSRSARGIPVHSVRCPRVSIDGLCAGRGLRPGVIKIDVEGGELQVLAGARQTLAAARPLIRVAFHPFAFDDPSAAANELRGIFSEARYRFDAPAEGALELREYVAIPEERARI